MHQKLIEQKKKGNTFDNLVDSEAKEKSRMIELVMHEKRMSAQIDKYEEKHGKIKYEAKSPEPDIESEESVGSSRERSDLKKKLSKKVQKTKAKMRAGGNRNAAAENMETIQEHSVDDSSIHEDQEESGEDTQNNGSSSDVGPRRAIESSDDEILSQISDQEEQFRLAIAESKKEAEKQE